MIELQYHDICIYVCYCMFIFDYVCIYICMIAYVYIYICIYTHVYPYILCMYMRGYYVYDM